MKGPRTVCARPFFAWFRLPELQLLRTTAGTVPNARTRGFLPRLDAGLLEVALVTQRLDDPLLVEDLLQALQTAFNGLALLQLELDCHACSPHFPPALGGAGKSG